MVGGIVVGGIVVGGAVVAVEIAMRTNEVIELAVSLTKTWSSVKNI